MPEIIADLANNALDVITAFDPDKQQNVTIQTVEFNGVSDLNIEKLKEAAKYLSDLINLKQIFQLVYEDFLNCYILILIGLGIAALISFIWMFVLRFIIKPVIYVTILIVLGVLAFGTYFCIQEYLDLKNKAPQSQDFEIQFQNLYDLDYLKNLKEAWLAFSIILGVLFLILALITLFLIKRIKLAAELIKEVSKAVVKIPASLFWPILPVLMQIGVIAYCVATALFLASSGIELYKVVNYTNYDSIPIIPVTQPVATIPAYSTDDSVIVMDEMALKNNLKVLEVNVGDYCLPEEFYKLKAEYLDDPKWKSLECFYYNFGFNATLPIGIDSADLSNYYTKAIEILNDYQWLPQVYIIFMLFWLFAFVNGLNQMTLAGSFGAYYWTRFSNASKDKKNNIPFFTLIGSFGRAIFYHFGTIAFGSLILAIVKLIRVILEFLHRKLKKKEDSSKIAKFLMCCCKCCFCCLERFIKFLNRYAFIITSIYSLNFCRAAAKAVKLITTNALRVLVIDKIANFILFLSTIAITASIGVASFYFFTKKIPIDAITRYTPELNFYVL